MTAKLTRNPNDQGTNGVRTRGAASSALWESSWAATVLDDTAPDEMCAKARTLARQLSQIAMMRFNSATDAFASASGSAGAIGVAGGSGTAGSTGAGGAANGAYVLTSSLWVGEQCALADGAEVRETFGLWSHRIDTDTRVKEPRSSREWGEAEDRAGDRPL